MAKTITVTLDEEQLQAALSLLNWSRATGFLALLHGRPRKQIQAEIDATNAVIRQIRRAIAPKTGRPRAAAPGNGDDAHDDDDGGPGFPIADALEAAGARVVRNGHAKRNGKGGAR